MRPIISKQANRVEEKLQTKEYVLLGGNEIYTPCRGIMRSFENQQCCVSFGGVFHGLSAEPLLRPCKQGKYFYVQANVLCILCESHVHSPAYQYHHLLHIPPV